jgi:hypothetical protein
MTKHTATDGRIFLGHLQRGAPRKERRHSPYTREISLLFGGRSGEGQFWIQEQGHDMTTRGASAHSLHSCWPGGRSDGNFCGR